MPTIAPAVKRLNYVTNVTTYCILVSVVQEHKLRHKSDYPLKHHLKGRFPKSTNYVTR